MGKIKQEKKVNYPSARFLVEACYQDYSRLHNDYMKLYDKISVALAFAGVVFTLIFNTIDFKSATVKVEGLNTLQVIAFIIHFLCIIFSILLLLFGTCLLFHLLKGKTCQVFKCEDVRNKSIYNEQENDAAVWLIEQYTTCVYEMRPIIEKRQASFQKAMKSIIGSLLFYTGALLLAKGGL